jgi:hypothetical protein
MKKELCAFKVVLEEKGRAFATSVPCRVRLSIDLPKVLLEAAVVPSLKQKGAGESGEESLDYWLLAVSECRVVTVEKGLEKELEPQIQLSGATLHCFYSQKMSYGGATPVKGWLDTTRRRMALRLSGSEDMVSVGTAAAGLVLA